jgi:hypothetical protein
LELLSIAHHEMHRAAMAVDAIAQPRSGENLKALGPARNNHPSSPPSARFLSEGIGKEATNLMQNGFSSSGWLVLGTVPQRRYSLHRESPGVESGLDATHQRGSGYARGSQ